MDTRQQERQIYFVLRFHEYIAVAVLWLRTVVMFSIDDASDIGCCSSALSTVSVAGVDVCSQHMD